MKSAAGILTILVLFFTAQPLLVNCQLQKKQETAKVPGCSKGMDCHKKESDQKTENKDCDQTNACNPFAICSGCQYIAAPKFSYPSAFGEITVEKIMPSLENIQSGFITDCFHPPKLLFG